MSGSSAACNVLWDHRPSEPSAFVWTHAAETSTSTKGENFSGSVCVVLGKADVTSLAPSSTWQLEPVFSGIELALQRIKRRARELWPAGVTFESRAFVVPASRPDVRLGDDLVAISVLLRGADREQARAVRRELYAWSEELELIDRVRLTVTVLPDVVVGG